MANQFLSLSLFLMLLSFFIVMNAVSGYEETKTQPVMRSISLAFSNEENVKDLGPSDEPTIIMNVGSGDTLSDIKGLFEGHISNIQATKNRLGTVMHIRVPVQSFRRAIEMPSLDNSEQAKLSNADEGSFLQTLVTVLRAEKSNMPYRADIILEVPYQPNNVEQENLGQVNTDLKMAAGFTSKLEEYGLPKQYISAGLMNGESGYISLYFRSYVPYSPVSEKYNERKEQEKVNDNEVPL
ncbi:MAG: hypothetical protein OEY94_02755 [Alphaproteobacteria bacterium]|nr:hypothetical protein [Alphaproteobacteria bacterium]